MGDHEGDLKVRPTCWPILYWRTALDSPEYYLYYSDLAVPIYRQSWFSRHISLVVGMINSCQLLIAGGFLLKGWINRMAVTAG